MQPEYQTCREKKRQSARQSHGRIAPMDSLDKKIHYDQATDLGLDSQAKHKQEGREREQAATKEEITADDHQRNGECRRLTEHQQNSAGSQDEGCQRGSKPAPRSWT